MVCPLCVLCTTVCKYPIRVTSHSSAWSIIAWKPLKNQTWQLEKHKNIKNVTFDLSFVYSSDCSGGVCICQLSCCVTGLMPLNVTSALGCCSPGETLAHHRQADTTHWQGWLVLRKHFELVDSLHTRSTQHARTQHARMYVCQASYL